MAFVSLNQQTDKHYTLHCIKVGLNSYHIIAWHYFPILLSLDWIIYGYLMGCLGDSTRIGTVTFEKCLDDCSKAGWGFFIHGNIGGKKCATGTTLCLCYCYNVKPGDLCRPKYASGYTLYMRLYQGRSYFRHFRYQITCWGP